VASSKGTTKRSAKFSKREVLRELGKVQAVSSRHLRLSLILAVELFRTNPKHPIFQDDTFTVSSLDTIKLDAKVHTTYEKLRESKG
jgi:hypothetical protein